MISNYTYAYSNTNKKIMDYCKHSTNESIRKITEKHNNNNNKFKTFMKNYTILPFIYFVFFPVNFYFKLLKR
jgi:hypothetical protein